jgi:hypothetical protein
MEQIHLSQCQLILLATSQNSFNIAPTIFATVLQ